MFRTRTQPVNLRRSQWSRQSRWSRARLLVQALEDRSVPATITVTHNSDVVAVDGNVTLREAILSINAGADINADVVAAGGYGTSDSINFGPLFASPQTITMDSGLAQMSITKAVTITGPGASKLTIDGNVTTPSATSRIFDINVAAAATITISGMTLTGGSVSSGNTGGAILVANEELVVSNVVISGNMAVTSGGAIAHTATGAKITISDSTISNNLATSIGGALFVPTATASTITINNSSLTNNSSGSTGGFLSTGTTTASVTLNITNSSISMNSAVSTGGGIHLGGPSTVTINNSVFDANLSDGNGGAWSIASTVTFNATSTSFTNNVGDNGGGFRITGVTATTVTLNECVLSGNTAATGVGGALYLVSSGTLNVNNCSILNNTATTSGGGIRGSTGSNINVINSTLAGNQASGSTSSTGGGAIGMFGAGTLNVRNSTVVNNAVPNATAKGGGIFTNVSTGTITFNSNIIANNMNPDNSSSGSDISSNGTLPRAIAGTKNIIGVHDATKINLTGGALNNQVGAIGSPLDPGLLPLGNYGGSTPTYILRSNSIAIDMGNNVTPTVSFDQRGLGFPRQVGSAVDVGSVEGFANFPFVSSTVFTDVTAGGSPYMFDVVYEDDMGVDTVTLGTVMGPANGISISGPTAVGAITLEAVMLDGVVGAKKVTASYKVIPPGGDWEAIESGKYTVNLAANKLFDLDMPTPNSAPAQVVGAFNVIIAGTLVVDNAGDTIDGDLSPGQVTLREAISASNSSAGLGDLIQFSGLTGTTITLTGELSITDGVTIDGPGTGAGGITIAGAAMASSTNRIFNINIPGTGGLVTLQDVTLRDGNLSSGNGGAILIHDEQIDLLRVHLLNNTVAVDGGAIGTTTIGAIVNLTDVLADSNKGTSTSASNGSVVFLATQATLTVNNSTFTNNDSGDDGGVFYGGASTTINVFDSTFENNKGSGTATLGGVIFVTSTGTPAVTINNSVFRNNFAGSNGGVIYATSSVTLNVSNSTFENNVANGTTGGGVIYIGSSSLGSASITNTVFRNNVAAGSGGVFYAAGGITLTFADSRLEHNTSNGTGGGAIYVGSSASATLNVNYTSIMNNAAAGAGGAIFMNGLGLLNIDRSTLANNTAGGGGGAIRVSTANGVDIKNSTLSSNVSTGNTSLTGGGAILQTGTSFAAAIAITNSTVYNNSATGVNALGGGIFMNDSDGTIALNSSILAGNLNSNNPMPNSDFGATTTRQVDVNRALIGASNTSMTLFGLWDPALVGTEGAAVNPQLYPLYNHGGASAPLTHGLQKTSPAIDQGNNDSGAFEDQRGTGFVRNFDDLGIMNNTGGDGTDLGALEQPILHPVPMSVTFDPLIDVGDVGGTTYVVSVVYQDDVSVSNPSILAGADLGIFRGASTTSLTMAMVSATATAGSVTATYTFTPPGGTWNKADNDLYTIKLLSNEVSDGSNFALPGTLGSFNVGVPEFYLVDSLADEDDMDYGPGDFTLREAIRRANTENVDTQDVISFAAAIHGKTINLGSPLIITDPIFINGLGSGQRMTISGQSMTRLFGFEILGAGAASKFQDLNLTQGNVTGSLSGGAISLIDDELSLTNVTITNSAAGGDGGAVYLTSGKLFVTNGVFTNNQANSTGGALNATAGTIEITNSVVSGNFATSSGGGIYLTTGSLVVDNSTVSNNRVNTGTGGGIDMTTGSAVITNSTVSGNAARTQGGGIYLSSGTLSVTGSTINNNTVRSTGGGGITATTGSVTLVNTTVSGNSAAFFAAQGGGIRLTSTGNLKAFNSTITNNSGPAGGGGIFLLNSSATVTLESTILAGNTASVHPDLHTIGTTPVTVFGTNNVIGIFSDPQFSLDMPGLNQFGDATIPLNAKLSPLGFYGKSTATHMLLNGSPAINMGTIASNPGLTVDQRGNPRNDGGGVDVGSTEGLYVKPFVSAATLGDVTIGGGTTYVATVVYSDSSGIDTTSINGSEVTLTRTGLSPISPSMVSVNPGAGSATATYTFTAPSGSWDVADNGIFSLNLLANTVSDGVNKVDAAQIGTFEANVPLTYLVDKFDVDVDDGQYGPGELTLREAIKLSAEQNPGFTDIITFSATTITLNSEIVITDRVTIVGNGPSKTIIEGSGAVSPTNRLFNVNIPGGSKLVSISNVTLTKGHAGSANGGAINSDDDSLILTNVVVDNNSGTDGGAINIQTDGALLRVESSTFTNNVASSTGGALSTIGYANVEIIDSVFINNSAVGGGAYYSVSTVTLNVDNSQFLNNSGTTSTGGGINTAVPADVVVSNSLFSGNTGTGGGGFNFGSTGRAQFIGTTFMNNTATSSGGGGIRAASTAVFIDVRNSTISGNVSQGSTSITGGGGIILTSTGFTGSLNIVNSTIANNSSPNAATKGGGIFVNDDTGTILLSSSIVAGNSNTLAPDISAGGVLPRLITVDYSLVGTIDAVSTFSIGGTFDPALVGTVSTVDPMLLPLAATYGGNVFVHGVKFGSPVVDQGLNSLGLAKDQRGFTRTIDEPVGNPGGGDGTDIGSVEGEFLNPVGSAVLADFKAIGQSKITLDVNYFDETALDFAEFGTADVALYRNNTGSPIVPTGFSVTMFDAKNAKVSYEFTAPGDMLWDKTDNDSYTLRLLDNQVYDKDTPTKNAAIGGDLDSFNVIIPLVFVVDNIGNDDDGIYTAGNQTLREAIARAAAENPGATDVIQFDPSLNGKTITLANEIPISESVEIQGPGASLLTISGAPLAASNNRIFNINIGSGPDFVTISGLTLANGNLSTGNGAAILSSNETVTLNKMVFTNNITVTDGGALATSSTSNITINDSTFIANAAGSDGGAIYAGTTATITINNSTFAKNGAAAIGGAIYTLSTVNLSINDSRFDANAAVTSGGALDTGSTATVTINNSAFTNNRASRAGALEFSSTSSTVTINNSVISGNTAATSVGGGVYFFTGGQFNANNVAFINNTAQTSGGALANWTNSATIRNSTFSGNVARGSTTATGGGAIAFLTTAFVGTFNLFNSTVVNNSATGPLGEGGGIFSLAATGTITLNGTIVADNSSASKVNPDISYGDTTATPTRAIDVNRSLVGTIDPLLFSVFGVYDPALVGFTPTVVNAKVHPLGYYGGPTQSHILQIGSPAVDQGNNASTPALTTDQRGPGFNRLIDDGLIANADDGTDIGAVEGVLNFPATSTALADVTNPGAATYVAQVTYTDPSGISTITIGTGDVRLSGTALATPIAPTAANIVMNTGTSVTVNYTFNAPGSSWEISDNGYYTLTMVNSEVKNAGSGFAAEGTLGTFQALVPNIYVVDKLGDVDDMNYGVGELTLREAVALANSSNFGYANKIQFSPALAGQTITLAGTELTLTKPVTIEGLGSTSLTIDAAGLSRIFNVTGFGYLPTTIAGLKLTGGNVSGANGGAINMVQINSLNMVDCIVTGNSAAAGGAISFGVAASTGNFTLVSFSNNSAMTTTGGAIHSVGGMFNIGSSTFTNNTSVTNGAAFSVATGANTVTVNNSIFANNSASGVGGALSLNTTNTGVNNILTINNSTFDQNKGTSGGAIYITGTNLIALKASSFTNNKATSASSGGGAIRHGGGDMTIESCLFDSNDGGNYGGAFGDTGGPAHNITISDSTITNNIADFGGGSYHDQTILTVNNTLYANNTSRTAYGGAIAIGGGNSAPGPWGVVLNNATFNENRSFSTGGAIHIASLPSGTDTFTSFQSTGTTFTGNIARGGAGGAVHMGRGTIIIDSTNFIRNRSQGSGGGFSSTTGPNHYTISNSLFEGNEGLQDGGGLIAASKSDLVMSNTIFRNNSTSRAGGGAFVQGVGSIWTINDSVFEGNRAGEGGGFANDDTDAVVNINRTTFSGNVARVGGGIGIGSDGTTTIAGAYTITNSTISGNEATSTVLGGGAISIHNFGWVGTLDIRNSTITGNKAVNGGGILGIVTADTISINSSIIAGNTATTKGRDFAFIAPRSINVDGVLIGSLDNSNATLSGTWNPTLVGTDVSPVDPGLYPLANNGGATKTHALRVGSKALDAGNDNFFLGVDQRGVTRTVPHDLGSFEGTLLTPIASFALANVPPASTDYIATIVYEDETAVNVGSIDPTDVVINGKAFAPNTAPYKVVTTGGGGKITADYYFTPPGGWDIADNGLYTITIVGDVNDGVNSVVKNQSSTFRVGFATSFKVDITTDEDDGNYGPGDLSLREAIRLANGSGEGSVDTITFDPTVFGTPQVITLTLGQMDITDSVVVNGPGMGLLTIDAGTLSRHFEFNGNGIIDVAMSGMTLINGNTTFFRDGGSIRIYYANATLTNMHLDSNKATEDGGAIYVLGSTVKTTLLDSKLTNNFAGTFGGGIGAHAAAIFDIQRSTVSGNSSNNNGGGIYFQYNGTLNLDRSTVSGNTAELVTPKLGGGGIYFYGVVDGGSFFITNSTISGNKASKTHGGGISLGYLTGAVTIRNSTITGNDAFQSGGGISNRYNVLGLATITLDSTIVAGNKLAGIDVGLPTIDLSADAAFNIGGSNNLIGIMDPGNNITLTGGGNLVGDVFTKLDALLGPLQNNGGPTLTHAVLAGSPAIDAGKSFGSPSDQRGFPALRTYDDPGAGNVVDGTDIGAFERQPIAPPTVSKIEVNGGAAQRSLVTTITVTFSESVFFPLGLDAAFDVSGIGLGASGAVNLDFSQVGPVVTITFKTGGVQDVDPGNSLKDGQYRLTIVADNVSGFGGTLDGDGDMMSEGSPIDDDTLDFHRLFGDGTGDGIVNAADFNLFRMAYGGVGPSIFDFDNNNTVNAADFNAFRLRYGLSGYLP